MYFAEREADRIGVHTTGVGPGKQTVTGSGPTRVRADGNYVYWVESGTDKVRRRTTATTGSNEDVSAGPGNTGEGGLAIDATHVYWVVAHGPSAGLYRAAKTGGPALAVKTGMKFPVDVALDDEYAYVTVHDENRVVRVRKN